MKKIDQVIFELRSLSGSLIGSDSMVRILEEIKASDIRTKDDEKMIKLAKVELEIDRYLKDVRLTKFSPEFEDLKIRKKNLILEIENSGEVSEVKEIFYEKITNGTFGKLIGQRAMNACLHSRVRTVGELMEYTPEELLNIRNMGKKSLSKIEDALLFYDLTLKKE